MSMQDLHALYRSTEQDMLFDVGLLEMPWQVPAPLIQIHYPNWSRPMLDIVRGSFRAGVRLDVNETAEHTYDVHLATRERISLQITGAGHSSVLHAPAWDAQLVGVAPEVVRRFEVGRRRFGGFLLLMQTPRWEFLSAVDESQQRIVVEDVRRRRMPLPGQT